MIIVLSPAKTLDFKEPGPAHQYSMPEYGKEAVPIAETLQKLSAQELGVLMDISPKLAYQTYERYMAWRLSDHIPEAKQAILAYKGDVYSGLCATDFTREELNLAQSHLRILSGLYGILRPLDLIMPYRLEFATKVSLAQYKNLYEYWEESLLRSLILSKEDEGSGILINLASAEYYRAINADAAGFRVITPVFKEYRNGELKFLSMFGKRARGMMARFLIRNGIDDPEQMKLFDEEGYSFSEPLSCQGEWVFVR